MEATSNTLAVAKDGLDIQGRLDNLDEALAEYVDQLAPEERFRFQSAWGALPRLRAEMRAASSETARLIAASWTSADERVFDAEAERFLALSVLDTPAANRLRGYLMRNIRMVEFPAEQEAQAVARLSRVRSEHELLASDDHSRQHATGNATTKTDAIDCTHGLSTIFTMLARQRPQLQFRLHDTDLTLEEVVAPDGVFPLIIDRAARGSGQDRDYRLPYGLMRDLNALMEVRPVIAIHAGDREHFDHWLAGFKDVIRDFTHMARKNSGIVDLGPLYENWLQRLRTPGMIIQNDKQEVLAIIEEYWPQPE